MLQGAHELLRDSALRTIFIEVTRRDAWPLLKMLRRFGFRVFVWPTTSDPLKYVLPSQELKSMKHVTAYFATMPDRVNLALTREASVADKFWK